MLTTDRERIIARLDEEPGSLEPALGEIVVNMGPRLMHICLICGRRDDLGPSPTGEPAVSHGLDHPGNEYCIAEYKRRFC